MHMQCMTMTLGYARVVALLLSRASGATKIDAGSMDAYLTAHFNIARLLSFRKESNEQKVRDWTNRCVRDGGACIGRHACTCGVRGMSTAVRGCPRGLSLTHGAVCSSPSTPVWRGTSG